MCRIIVLGLLSFLLLSCTNNKVEKPAVIPTDTTNVHSSNCTENLSDTISFAKHIVPIFRTNCAIASCHSGSRPEGNLNLETSVAYVHITRPNRGYLDINVPKNSILYNSLTSTANQMPPFPSSKLNDCEINQIMKWMKQGAKNN